MANKIGILTWHYYVNFGSGLQAFALQKTIEDLGYDVRLINYRNLLYDNHCWWKILAKHILRNTICRISKSMHDKYVSNTEIYQARYLKQTRRFTKPELLYKFIDGYSSVVYGSDQIWAPNVYAPIYMGAYVPNVIKKISYAASIGLNEIPDNLTEAYRQNLSSYHAVAVREDEGQRLLKSRCGIDATVVLDPTLMVDVATYKKMLRPVDNVKSKYIFCYFLNQEHNYKENVIEYAKAHNLHIVGVSDKHSDLEWMQRVTNIGADQFLWLINNAETIFTDSYHGSIFSLLFHKNLWIFTRFAEDSPICQNSRIRQLQNNFNLSHRIIAAGQVINDSRTIDYNYFEERLAALRKESLLYLKNALE